MSTGFVGTGFVRAGSGGLPPILLIGRGKMGGALLAGWLERGLEPSVVVDPRAVGLAQAGVSVVETFADVPAGFAPACVVLAVKPQDADAVLRRRRRIQCRRSWARH